MSEFSDLPDGVKKAIEDLLDALSGMTPDQIFELLADMLGDDILENLYDLITNENEFTFVFDDQALANLDSLLQELEELSPEYEGDIEPYYEIANLDNESGEIIVEMPVCDDSYIDWYQYEGEIFIYSTNGYQQYKLIIPLPEFYLIVEDNIVYKNGLFILPFVIE